MMDYGEQTTGTTDEHYNLISVLYHALNGADTCDRYASDAEIAGDERLAAFFRETQTMQTQIAERAKGLLGILEPPPEFGVEPGTTSGGVPPETPGYLANDLPPTTDLPRTPPRGTTGDHIRRPDSSAGRGRTTLRRSPAERRAAAEGGAATGGGKAREARVGAHAAAEPAGRTAAGRGETRETHPTIALRRYRLLYRTRGCCGHGHDATCYGARLCWVLWAA